MTKREKKDRAIYLYHQGYPTGVIADMLDVNEIEVVKWIGLY